MPDHRDRSASALVHGPAKPSDIERVRLDVDEAEARVARAEEVSVTHVTGSGSPVGRLSPKWTLKPGPATTLSGLHRPSPSEAVGVLRARVGGFAYDALTDDLCLLAARIT